MKRTVLIILLVVFMTSCDCVVTSKFDPVSEYSELADSSHIYARRNLPSVYYWKTVFQLSEFDRDFIRQHDIGRMYIRFFDVGASEKSGGNHRGAIPIATIYFKDKPMSDIEIVPTVYITIEAMKNIASDPTQNYAELIVNRIITMIQTNEIENVHEIQIDCDWTQTTRTEYFLLLKNMKNILDSRNSVMPHPLSISATIRLHQLRQSPPPVDRGVLMCYNTGSIKSASTRNSIIDYYDIYPYLEQLEDYTLPLDVAYPTFGWAVWFRGKEFLSLIRKTDFSDTTKYVADEEDNTYKVIADHYLVDKYLRVGDKIRCETSAAGEIKQVKRSVENYLPNKETSTILYHLDSTNLSKYTYDEVKSFYNR